MRNKSDNIPTNPLVERAIECCGTQEALASAVGVPQQRISKILRFKAPLTGEIAVKIEAATNGKITRRMLRPDLFVPRAKLPVPANVVSQPE